MENQNQSKLKLKISRMFRSSFGYCKSVSDAIERPHPSSAAAAAADQPHRHYQLIELFSPKVEPLRHIRRDKWSKFVESVDQNCSLAKDRIFLGKKVSPIAPPVSPISSEQRTTQKQRTQKQRNQKQRKQKKKRATVNFDKYYEFFSSEDEEEDDGTMTLFSSRSLSSDSSVSFRGSMERRRMRREGKAVGMNMMMIPLDDDDNNKVKDSLMVVKKSKDPYNDFRNSMVEMIVEKQLFAARDLEKLLQTFLSLNSSNHHRVITEVYTEIWETLFSNWS